MTPLIGTENGNELPYEPAISSGGGAGNGVGVRAVSTDVAEGDARRRTNRAARGVASSTVAAMNQCAPANPRMPMLDDMQEIMRTAYYWRAQGRTHADQGRTALA